GPDRGVRVPAGHRRARPPRARPPGGREPRPRRPAADRGARGLLPPPLRRRVRRLGELRPAPRAASSAGARGVPRGQRADAAARVLARTAGGLVVLLVESPLPHA